MSQHTPPTSHRNKNLRCLPVGCRKLIALEVAEKLVAAIHMLRLPRGMAHLRDHLHQAADNTVGTGGWCSVSELVSLNTVLRLSEASGRTMGNRYQHLEAAYSENQEVQAVLELIKARQIEVPVAVVHQSNKVGGLIYGLLRADMRFTPRG